MKILQNRKKLKELSKIAKIAVKEGAFSTVNEALKSAYIEENEEIKEFNTFNQWAKIGKKVKKGAKAFLLWGQPRKVEQDEENDEFTFWPLCYVFANTQVEEKGGRNGKN